MSDETEKTTERSNGKCVLTHGELHRLWTWLTNLQAQHGIDDSTTYESLAHAANDALRFEGKLLTAANLQAACEVVGIITKRAEQIRTREADDLREVVRKALERIGMLEQNQKIDALQRKDLFNEVQELRDRVKRLAEPTLFSPIEEGNRRDMAGAATV